MTIVESGCCCDGNQIMYLAYACWPNRSRAFSFVEPTGSNVTTIFNGSDIDSTNPPTATPAIMWMVGGGGGSQSSDVIGGAGAILEKQTTLPASSTIKVGQGGFGSTGTSSNVATVFGGGAKGAADASGYGEAYGGGATGWTGASGMIAGGGGGGGSQEFFTQYVTDANGGDAGIASAIDSCGHTGCGTGANGATPGTGGTLGTQATATAGLGGTGSAQVSGAAGGGGGGGGYAGGGRGTNTAGTPPVYGGGPGGGGDSVGYTVGTSEAGLNGLTQANGVSASAGDGGIAGQGNDGYAVISWRKCQECQCPEASTGLPPALYICLTQEQVDIIVAATSLCEFQYYGTSIYIVFEYQGYPFMLETSPHTTGPLPIDPNRQCTRTVDTGDIDVSQTYYSGDIDGCCQVTEAVLYNELCTSACVDTCPEVLYLCGAYLDSIGVPACRDPKKYYRIDYNGCIYLLGTGSNAQCVSDVYDPLNVGEYGGETTNPPVQYFYQVGPHTFSGGFFCCSPITISASVNWTSVVAVVPYNDGCNDGTASFPLFTSNPGTGSGTFTFVCESAVDGIALMASPNACVPMSNPCSCGKKPCDVNNTTFQTVGGNCNSASVDPCGSQVTQKLLNMSMSLYPDPGSVAAVTLTLTRSTASSGTTWASVDTFNGAIYIDDCIFQGSGQTSDFANSINKALDGCIVATAAQKFWLGERCCTLTPQDCERCRGGSDDWVLSSISTTVAVFSAKYSVWGLIQASYTYQELGCRVCAGTGTPGDPYVNVVQCCSGSGYPCSATWTSQFVAEQPDVSPVGSDFMPCVLDSESCASSDPPISVQGGGNIVLS